jgi:hypothetical protein
MAGDVAGDYLLKGLIHMGPPNLEIPKPTTSLPIKFQPIYYNSHFNH